jgi:hypothetical protein
VGDNSDLHTVVRSTSLDSGLSHPLHFLWVLKEVVIYLASTVSTLAKGGRVDLEKKRTEGGNREKGFMALSWIRCGRWYYYGDMIHLHNVLVQLLKGVED